MPDAGETTAIIGAVTALVTALATLVSVVRSGRKIDAVHREVHTPEGTTLAADVHRLVENGAP